MKMDSQTAISLPNLLCEEDDSSLDEVKFNVLSQSRSEDDRYIRSLIEREAKSDEYVCVDDRISKARSQCARFNAVNWIFSNRETLGFNFRTVYLSVTYFDRFNSRLVIDKGKEWAVELLSIACLSLAAKMEEQIAPPLSHYKTQGFNFETSVIQRMELLVLTTLGWKMCGITPFAYLHHFFSKICADSAECHCNEALVSKAIGFILDFSKEVNLMGHRPSVVAMAAVLLACDDQLTRSTMECKIGSVSSLLEKEPIYHCYNLMKELEVKKNNTPNSNSFDLSRNHWSTSSNIGIKRKLTYNDFEQTCAPQKISREF